VGGEEKIKARHMAKGGFLVKFDGKEVVQCYAIALDYDERRYTINDVKKKKLPAKVKTITVEIEDE
jgi:hypothetical protein